MYFKSPFHAISMDKKLNALTKVPFTYFHTLFARCRPFLIRRLKLNLKIGCEQACSCRHAEQLSKQLNHKSHFTCENGISNLDKALFLQGYACRPIWMLSALNIVEGLNSNHNQMKKLSFTTVTMS